MLATCFLRMAQHRRALDYAAVAWQQEPGSSACCFIRLRALLALHELQRAEEEVQALLACADFHISHLQVAGGCLGMAADEPHLCWLMR